MKAIHLVLHDLSPDIRLEGRRVAFAPVLVHDVEVHGVADDEDVLHRPNGVGVVATAAHHAPQRSPTSRKVKICLFMPSGPNNAAIQVPTTSAGRNALNGPGCQ